MEEHFFQCPYCWETISMLFDSSLNHQDYIEDCEVCCNPISIAIVFDTNALVSLNANTIEQ